MPHGNKELRKIAARDRDWRTRAKRTSLSSTERASTVRLGPTSARGRRAEEERCHIEENSKKVIKDILSDSVVPSTITSY
eukprot:12634107-Heterocapsa_arctica.AAC.1